MANVCIITGGGSGMGLEAAKLLGKDQRIILVGRTVSKLEGAVAELQGLGIEAEAFPADAGDRASVEKLAEYATSLGTVKNVLHAAGVSPHMDDPERIFTINTLGTINIDEVFGPIVAEGGCILNVASMAGHMLPADQAPVQLYQLALSNSEAFLGGAQQMLTRFPAEQATGAAYSISKNFVQWYTVRMAVKFGKRGVRVVSISPGTFDTPMGKIEGEEASNIAVAGALGRVGDPAEIARMMAFILSDECSYLTGTDILYDGGAVAALKVRADQQ